MPDQTWNGHHKRRYRVAKHSQARLSLGHGLTLTLRRRMAAALHLATLPRPTGRYAPSRRPRRAQLTAAAGPADFSSEQLQSALQHQLDNAGSAPAEASGEAASRVPKKKTSRRAERAAAAAAAVRAAAVGLE